MTTWPSPSASVPAELQVPAGSRQRSTVQATPSSHATAVPAMQPAPATHISTPLQARPSLQRPWSGALAHASVSVSHVSIVQGTPSSQLTESRRQPMEGSQRSVPLQKTPSSHSASLSHGSGVSQPPSGSQIMPLGQRASSAGYEHAPVSGSHRSVVQSTASAHSMAMPGRHCPSLHTSTPLQASASSHSAALSHAGPPASAEPESRWPTGPPSTPEEGRLPWAQPAAAASRSTKSTAADRRIPSMVAERRGGDERVTALDPSAEVNPRSR
ncbi:MAG: hypothetical protein M5U28_51375 [Sandaracinaceae bacterium]|nr:hypothetical protein [Sandaracinaceae bacterium]